jgi:hypothetical protein
LRCSTTTARRLPSGTTCHLACPALPAVLWAGATGYMISVLQAVHAGGDSARHSCGRGECKDPNEDFSIEDQLYDEE